MLRLHTDRRRVLLCLIALSSGAAGSGGSAPQGGPLAVVVHKSSRQENITTGELRKMLTGDLRVWQDSSPVVLVQQPDENPSQKRMLKILLKTTPAGYNNQLLQVQFQGRALPAIRVLNSDANAIAFVWNVPGAVSVVDAAAAEGSIHVKILRVDGKLPGEAGYPLQ